MLPDSARLRSSRRISEVSRRGVRVAGSGVVVHALVDPSRRSVFAVAVGKSVGGSVERHRLARQLREAVRPLANTEGGAVLIRALPDARGRRGAEFQQGVRETVQRALAKARGQSAP